MLPFLAGLAPGSSLYYDKEVAHRLADEKAEGELACERCDAAGSSLLLTLWARRMLKKRLRWELSGSGVC